MLMGKHCHETPFTGISRTIYATISVPRCEQVCMADSRSVICHFGSIFLRDIGNSRKCYISRYGSYRGWSFQPCLNQGPLHQLCRGFWWSSPDDSKGKDYLGKYVVTRLIIGHC